MTKLEEYKEFLQASYQEWGQIQIKCERAHFLNLAKEDLDKYNLLFKKRCAAEMWIDMLSKKVNKKSGSIQNK